MYNPYFIHSSSQYPVNICTSELRQKQMFLQPSVEGKKNLVCLPLIKKKPKKTEKENWYLKLARM